MDVSSRNAQIDDFPQSPNSELVIDPHNGDRRHFPLEDIEVYSDVATIVVLANGRRKHGIFYHASQIIAAGVRIKPTAPTKL